jgi:hypothetical protein
MVRALSTIKVSAALRQSFARIIGTTHTFDTLDHHRLSIRSMAVTMTSLYKSVRHWSADDGDQVDKTACIVGLSSPYWVR